MQKKKFPGTSSDISVKDKTHVVEFHDVVIAL